MLKKYWSLIMITLPFIGLAQPTHRNEDSVLKTECDGKRFFKTEELPSLTVSKKVFADSIMTFLQKKESPPVKAKITCIFLLTKRSQILDLETLNTYPLKTNALADALRHFSYLWKPAVQNGYEVCAYTKLYLEFSEGQLNIVIRQ